jgi:hypothetical protein
MIQAASCSVEFNRDCDTGRDTGSEAEEEAEAKAKAVADAEDNGVRNRAGEQTQRAVLAAQQVVSEIKTAENVKIRAGDADEVGISSGNQALTRCAYLGIQSP